MLRVALEDAVVVGVKLLCGAALVAYGLVWLLLPEADLL